MLRGRVELNPPPCLLAHERQGDFARAGAEKERQVPREAGEEGSAADWGQETLAHLGAVK